MVFATEIIVAWMKVPPLNENGIIESYEVSYHPLEAYDRDPLSLNTTELFVSLTNLHEFAWYSIRVRATQM